jgi:hypothetical protein
MSPLENLEVAAFDEKNARYIVLGKNRWFLDPRSAEAAGCIVTRGPLAAAGVVLLSTEPPKELRRAPRVISNVRGTEYRPPHPRDPSPEPERNAPQARRRR